MLAGIKNVVESEMLESIFTHHKKINHSHMVSWKYHYRTSSVWCNPYLWASGSSVREMMISGEMILNELYACEPEPAILSVSMSDRHSTDDIFYFIKINT